MLATLHIAVPHHPLAAFTTWLTEHFRHRQPRPADITALDIEALRLSLPLDHPDRHALEDPRLENAFAHLAADHPEEVTPVPAAMARQEDVEEIALAIADDVFHRTHGAECFWAAADREAYEQLMARVHARCHSEFDRAV